MTRNSAQNRRLDVLRAIVTQYVATREPVGSKAIAAGGLGVSSATIRNDMAVLEEAGLIYQPHTSAGRVPTDRGYRVFVDRLAELKPMSGPERAALETFLSESVDIDDVVERSVRLLAQVTHQVALVQYPVARARLLKHLEVIDLAPGRLLVVVVTADGEVGERTLSFNAPLGDGQLREARELLRRHCDGATCATAQACVDAATASARPELVGTVAAIGTALTDVLSGQSESKIVVAGAANLARGALDFHDIAPVLDALEEQVVLMRLFAEADQGDDLHVSIGTENPHDGLSETAVVTGTYRAGSDESDGSAHLGIVGPMRMDYARTMSSVRAVAAYLSRYLAQQAHS
ncbi:heat-inducible transcriptional repressor HrcA [Schaalia odontolytica]|uniref:Heat-inducible transcription repressor HrcA n=1 Tax=Schaalia odontolytica TaxID=1660 RepID=A0A2X0TZA9_9ACTO|nr:heat-inducible transcriptional repressor HrcA [Schaalia odontolytica]WMS27632.1 heat-inducible transcriptional repressor HrcA [Schaalia odontolytica]SPT54839.1 Heat-inducible transcription repressor HrcA [Schaalia odontolytica]